MKAKRIKPGLYEYEGYRIHKSLSAQYAPWIATKGDSLLRSYTLKGAVNSINLYGE